MRCAIALTALWLTAAGCASQAPRPDLTDPAAPVLHGDRAGLELRIWGLRERPDHNIAVALAPWAEGAGPLPPELRDLWGANGLRLVRVPVDRLAEVQEALGSPGAVQRQWLGEHPQWMELVRGPQAPRQVVLLDSGLLTLQPGRLRLLTRCWVTPSLPGSGMAPEAQVRLDLAVQHQSRPKPPSLRDLVDQPQRPPVEAEGVVFSRFVAEAALGPTDALLIVPERPGVIWGEPPKPDEPATAAGPPAPALPSLGEAMLWQEPGAAGAMRIVVVLIPRLPDRFELAAAIPGR